MHTKITGLATILATLPLWAYPASGMDRSVLSHARSWGYQLQDVDLPSLAATNADLLVIDYSRDGSAHGVFSASDIATLKIKPDGTHRFVLAYFSIGEAESYRFYWQQEWRSRPPSWLLTENVDWRGNYAVRFWDPEWQAILFGSPESYLDRIMAAGFDGVYLDRVDAYEYSDPERGRSQLAAQMIALVRSIATYGRETVPGFIVVSQNGEELLADGSYRRTIDGLGKEDLLYGAEADAQRNSNGDIRASLGYLGRLTSVGKPVFLVEYLTSPATIAQARADAQTLGMALFISDRDLDNATSR
jgi:cysteinyl-tRNA synthetase